MIHSYKMLLKMTGKNFESELKNLDRNLEQIVNECLENDLKEEKVYELINEKVCKGANRKLRQINRTRNALNFLKILVLTLMTSYVLTKTEFTSDILKMIGRKMLINVKPYYDWTEFYDTNCFIKAPRPNIKENVVNCNLCESVSNFEFIKNEKSLNRLPELIDNHRPSMISSSLLNEPIFNLTIDQLIDFYLKLDYDDRVCMFESSLNVASVFDLMARLNDLELPLYSQFENCGYSLRKKVRSIYQLPSFMPMMLEFSRENWFLLSVNSYKSRNFKKVDIASGTKLAVIYQAYGSNQIRLKAKGNCSISECVEVEGTVNENDLVVFSTTLYDVHYLPVEGNKINLALLLGAVY